MDDKILDIVAGRVVAALNGRKTLRVYRTLPDDRVMMSMTATEIGLPTVKNSVYAAALWPLDLVMSDERVLSAIHDMDGADGFEQRTYLDFRPGFHFMLTIVNK